MIFHYTWALPLVTSLRLSVHGRLTMAITTWQDWYVWYRYIAMSHSMWIYVSLSKEFNATRDTIMVAHTFSLDWSECSVIIVRCGGRPCCSCSVQLSVVHGNITDKPHDGITVCVFLMSAKPMTKTLQKNLIEDTKIASGGGVMWYHVFQNLFLRTKGYFNHWGAYLGKLRHRTWSWCRSITRK